MSAVETSDPPLPRDQAKAHYAWRSQVNRRLPEIASRVFALRGKLYMGCGFHYGMEAELGYVLARVNGHGLPITLLDSTIEQVRFHGLLRDLVRAEFSARGWTFPDRRKPT